MVVTNGDGKGRRLCNNKKAQSAVASCHFYPYDSMLARGTSCSLMSVCLSVCQKSEFYENGCTDHAGFWHGGCTFDQSFILCYKDIRVSGKIAGTSF